MKPVFITVTQALLFGALVVTSSLVSAEGVSVVYKGAGWIQFGRVEKSTDTISNGSANNFNKNWIQNTGGQITAVAKISEDWEGGLGLGAIQVSNSRGSIFGAHTWSNQWNPFVTEARATYTRPLSGKNKAQVTIGSFPYDYNPDIRNFGLYLTRGQVYPGTLFSGFETKHILPIATQVGALARIQLGGFQNDFLLNSETETKPYFDFSLINIASYHATPWLQIGGGVNFYRLLPQNPDVTSPGKGLIQRSSYQDNNTSNIDETYYILDTVSVDTISGIAIVDTVTGSMSGTKLGAFIHLDLKMLFGLTGKWGKNDLILYGEAAILGLKSFPKYYQDIYKRIPIMVGFNLPAFGVIDKLTFEIEYYGSRNYSDYGNAEQSGSWVPRIPSNPAVNTRRDDWKWSLYGSRVLMGHLKVAIQVANDHLVLPSPPAAQDPSWAEVFSTPKDWYWMCKLAYFF